jgi:hypothetical protein
VSKPRLGLERPTRAVNDAARTAAKLAGEGTVRLVLEMAPSTRQALKVKAAQEGVTIKGYLLRLAAHDGVDVQEHTDHTDHTD